MIDERDGPASTAERLSGRLLIGLTYTSVALLLGGVALMLRAGISPMAGGPGLELSTLASELGSFGPAGFIWLGLLAVIATPISRVVFAGVAYARHRDWPMVAAAVAILAIIGVGVVVANAATV